MAILIRQALESDRAAMKHIAALTWGGEDYLPQVLDEWLTEPEGRFFVACDTALAGEPVVGMGRLTRFGEGEWWLEAIRVAPDRYQQGIGRTLHNALVAQAEAVGSGVLRMATGGSNTAIHKLAAATDFVQAGNYVFYRADPIALSFAETFRPLVEDDLPEARHLLAHSPYFQAAGCSLEQDWRWMMITDERLHERMAQALLYGWYPAAGHLTGLVILTPASPAAPGRIPMLNVAYLDAAVGELANMAQAVRGLAAKLGFRKIQMHFCALPERLVAMEQAGWRRRRQDEIHLFSRRLTDKL